ncbi:hypothetical protein POVWA2_002690 [Plasmodium ovale wallikeri]|uniref:Uncharacterized protein n=1 Tax=Plasmodium ovale wallikeri TaxID=864142 RepID=A0A1A9ALY7_PLAOA|nr:hypothetical protein POVWA2_002690 [Plasmodium ovale wallikeri]SBT57204.1 hypothetical protein POVWA1_080700 [Plasmodium ovale wallikeri]
MHLLECVLNASNFPIKREDFFSFFYFKNSSTMISGIKRTSRVNALGYTNILFIYQTNINTITCNFGTFPIILDSTAKADDNDQIGQTLHRQNINITYF